MLLCCGGGCRKAAAPSKHTPPAKPNVLVYLVDTLRSDHLGVYGYDRDTSPNLDAFARDAVVFDRAYTPSAWTKPSTASLLSGLYPRRHGGISRADRIADGVQLAGSYLSPAGYTSAAFMTNPNTTALWGFDRGFDVFEDIFHPGAETRADEVVDRVLAALPDLEPGPFFAYIHTHDPHDPYAPPPPFDRKWTDDPLPPVLTGEMQLTAELLPRLQAAYDGEIAFGDVQFGRLMDRLKADGLYDDMLIIFTADHGEEFGDHGGLSHGHSLFDELVHVPLIVKFPGNDFAGTHVAARASLLDILPTVLDAAGVTPPEAMSGRNLLDVADSSADGDAFPLFFDLDIERIERPGERFVGRGVVAGPYKYIHMAAPRMRDYLFDMSRDPDEYENLYSRQGEQDERMTQLLAAHEAAMSAGVHLRMRNHEDAAPVSIVMQWKTDGRFVNVQAAQMEAGDAAQVSDDGKTLDVTVRLENRAHAIPNHGLTEIDEDYVSFAVEPAGATVRCTGFKADGDAEAGLFRGADCEKLSPGDAVVDPADASWWVPDVSLMLRPQPNRPRRFPPGCYVAVVAPLERATADIDPETEARLRALGYIK